MSAFIRFFSILCVLTVTACGGGSSGPKSSSSIASSSSVSSSSSSSSSSSQLSSIPSEILPDDFPTGTIDALPALYITTENAAPILSKETYVNGSFSLSGADVTAAEGTLEIRGRGNSTWDWDKKPFRVKLTNSTAMLGMPANKHWVLLANYADKTLIRNDIALMFARSVGLEFTSNAKHVELTLNGSYRGAYQLVEHIRVGNNRVNIPELEETDTDTESITGGYLMEIDFRMASDFCQNPANYFYAFCQNGVNLDRAETFCVDSNYGMSPFCIDTPEDLLEPEWSAQREYIENYIADTESALFGVDFADPETGYAAYLDVDSTVNYYIVNELFKNADGAVASAYLYKKRAGKLFFGPIWDFDLALGNAGYNNLDKTYGWHIRNAPWFDRLFQDPAFEAKVKARWQALKAEGRLELIFHYADARALWLQEVQARNFDIWQIFYWESWYTRVILGSYDAEVNEMIRWQRERMNWMDAELSQ